MLRAFYRINTLYYTISLIFDALAQPKVPKLMKWCSTRQKTKERETRNRDWHRSARSERAGAPKRRQDGGDAPHPRKKKYIISSGVRGGCEKIQFAHY